MCKRNIGKSVRLINDILECMDENDTEAILFSADFEKAFDSIEHSFIISTLRAFGFGPDFIRWVKTFFKNAESCVMNNGRSAGYFPFKEVPDKEILFLLTFSLVSGQPPPPPPPLRQNPPRTKFPQYILYFVDSNIFY